MSATMGASASPASAAASKLGWGTGGGLSTSQEIDGIFGSSFSGFADVWSHQFSGEEQDDSSQAKKRQQPAEPELSLFTPLVARMAAAFLVNDALSKNQSILIPVFIADIRRGIRVYELNLKVLAGVFHMEGDAVNRFS